MEDGCRKGETICRDLRFEDGVVGCEPTVGVASLSWYGCCATSTSWCRTEAGREEIDEREDVDAASSPEDEAAEGREEPLREC